MTLRSRLFSDSKQLQACAVSDAAHVMPGASGDHVVRIQSALLRLRAMKVADARTEVGHYGPRTAAAILLYKQAFDIVNRNYQSRADNIVGRMTVASLDHAIYVLDGGATGRLRLSSWPGPHPQSPTVVAAPSATGGFPVRQALATVTRSFTVGAPSAVLGPPLSNLPEDIRAAILRSNDAKKPNEMMLYPFIDKHEWKLSASDLSERLGSHPDATAKLLALHSRMRPFDIWKNIRVIISVYEGIGSRGIFCEPFDHNAFLAQMTRLTIGPGKAGTDPFSRAWHLPLMDSKFCCDLFNVHGKRDSFREIVNQGPGLHICIAQPAVRSTTPCDLHIDEVQQGQVCHGGFCIPIVNGQTIEHLRTVGPWLADEAMKLMYGPGLRRVLRGQ